MVTALDEEGLVVALLLIRRSADPRIERGRQSGRFITGNCTGWPRSSACSRATS